MQSSPTYALEYLRGLNIGLYKIDLFGMSLITTGTKPLLSPAIISGFAAWKKYGKLLIS